MKNSLKRFRKRRSIIKKYKELIRINFLGIGYIGLQTAVVVANNGYKVFGIDIDHNLVFFLLTVILNKNRSTPLTKKFLFLVKSTPKPLIA